jgi:hypothetical protein
VETGASPRSGQNSSGMTVHNALRSDRHERRDSGWLHLFV